MREVGRKAGNDRLGSCDDGKSGLERCVIAESDTVEVVEGNVYFPAGSVNSDYTTASEYRTTCPWKGKAHYYNLEVAGNVNENAAWFYPEPKDAASNIKDHVAFWKGVDVEK